MNDLFTAFQNWIQGQINLCVDGLLARVTRLEELRIDDQITGLRMENDALHRLLQDIGAEIEYLKNELQDRRVENAPDEELSSFAERVYECFDSEEFRDAVGDKIADYIDSSDDVCTLDQVKDFIDSNVSVELSVSRW